MIDRLPLRTARLTLRRLRPGDAPRVTRLMGDWDVVKQTGHIAYPYTEAAARAWIGREAWDWSRGLGCALAIEDATDGTFMGALSFRLDDRSLRGGRAEIGYWIGKAYWGGGLATEAVEAAVPWFSDLSGARSIEAVTFAENDRSQGVLRKAGFRFVRATTRHYPVRGGLRRVSLFRWGETERHAGFALWSLRHLTITARRRAA